MAMIVVMSVFNGFSDLAMSRLSLLDPEGLVTPKDGAVIINADHLAKQLEKLPEIKAARPRVEGQGLAYYDNGQMPVKIVGVPEDYQATSNLDQAVIDGGRIEAGAYATLGVGVAMSLDARPAYAAPIVIAVPRRTARINPALPVGAFVCDTATVTGVFSTQQSDRDADAIYLPIDRVRRLLEYDNSQASAIELSPTPGVASSDMNQAVEQFLGSKYDVESRQEQEQTSLRMINVEKWITFALLTFILVMAGFNLISSISMLVTEKKESISIYWSLGAKESLIKSIFFNEGALITVVGGVMGLIMGFILCLFQKATGFIQMGGNHSQMSITAYPVALDVWDFATVAMVVIILGFFAGASSLKQVATEREK